MTKEELVKYCKKGKPHAQEMLYQRFSAKYLAVCKRYIKRIDLAEDAMIQGFVKVFKHIRSLKKVENLESWMNRIFINECLMELRKNHNFNVHLEDSNIQIESGEDPAENLYKSEMLKLLDELPTGCKTVFNLYAIEGFKHKEIAEQLNRILCKR